MAKHWKVGTDMFGGVHVYDEGGDRLTNDRMNGTDGWQESARLIASAPDLLGALRTAREALNAFYVTEGLTADGRAANLAFIDAAISKATPA